MGYQCIAHQCKCSCALVIYVIFLEYVDFDSARGFFLLPSSQLLPFAWRRNLRKKKTAEKKIEKKKKKFAHSSKGVAVWVWVWVCVCVWVFTVFLCVCLCFQTKHLRGTTGSSRNIHPPGSGIFGEARLSSRWACVCVCVLRWMTNFTNWQRTRAPSSFVSTVRAV